jgi:hypothetical protein
MKELSIEEKAKRYDEILARAEGANLPYYKEDIMSKVKEFVDYLIPELAETEDERIRKALIKYFTLSDDNADYQCCGVHYKDIVAWLEKQGAKVSAIEGFETEFERQVSDLIASAINKEHEYNQGYVKWTANALLNYAKHELEKPCEQKPVEWSAYDKATLEYIIEDIKELRDSEIDESSIEAYERELNLLQAINESTKLSNYTNPAQWSEEDEKMLNDILMCGEHHCYLDVENINWLYSLKDRIWYQPAQEWSEENERKIDRIYSILRQAADTHAFSTSCRLIGDKECIELQDFLKSLRPQNKWKPSTLQIEALESATENCAYSEYQDCLRELAKQLKKL